METFTPSVGGSGRRGFWLITHGSYSRHQIHSDTLNCLLLATFSFQGHIISFTSHSQQQFRWRTDILRNRFIGCPWKIAITLTSLLCLKRWVKMEQIHDSLLGSISTTFSGEILNPSPRRASQPWGGAQVHFSNSGWWLSLMISTKYSIAITLSWKNAQRKPDKKKEKEKAKYISVRL